MSKYSDGEFQPYEESIRGLRVFIVCSTFPTADNLMEMLLMIDAAKRASARHITAVIPILIKDKIEKTSQGSDRAKLVANLCDATR
jgi:ribose-phosphate pyrophosphokinase